MKSWAPTAKLLATEITTDMVYDPTPEEKAAYMRYVGITYLKDFGQGEIIGGTQYDQLQALQLALTNRVDITQTAADLIIRDCGGFTDDLRHARHFPDKMLMVTEDLDRIEDLDCVGEERQTSAMVLGRYDGQFFIAILAKRNPREPR